MRAVPMKIESHLMTEKRRSLRGVWVVILVLLLAAAGAAVFFLVALTFAFRIPPEHP